MHQAITLFILLSSLLTTQAEKPIGLKLPTNNDHIFGKTPEKFYMYCDRNFEGKASKPWTAGQYGYVRNLRRTDEGIIATRFHEGIDISPVKRDSAGRPLDIISAIAEGTVVHTSPIASNSNYGIYIVIEHNWGSGPFYSLYAHLSKISCTIGQKVHAGMPIATMGYTGAGINRTRAHLHLELNVMTNTRYPAWHAIHFNNSANKHGIYNGLNMNGLNIAELYLRHKRNPNLSLTSFIGKIPTYFKVTIPRKGPLDIAQRHIWMRLGNHRQPTPAWEISFSSSGFPLAITPSNRAVVRPTITYVKPTKSNHKYHTKGILTGTGSQASLTSIGSRVIQLISGDFPDPPIKAEIIEEAPTQ